MLRRVAVIAVLAALMVPAYGQVQRVSTDEVGSVVIFPKVELRWSHDGLTLQQDVFIDLTNDGPGSVKVLLFMVGEECTVRLNDIFLTAHQPMYFAASTGAPGPRPPGTGAVSSFSLVGAPYPDPEAADPNAGTTQLVLRGFIVAFAVNNADFPIRWNHLFGQATFVDYLNSDAWEYSAYTFAAIPGADGTQLNTTGQLDFDGTMYAIPFNVLLLDFFYTVPVTTPPTAGPFSHGAIAVMNDTDLTLMPLTQNFREGGETSKTKVEFHAWNENESSFGFPAFCLEKWSQQRLTAIDDYFLASVFQTNKGYTWIYGADVDAVCPDSEKLVLLGVQAKKLTFATAAGTKLASAGGTLSGFNSTDPAFPNSNARIRYTPLPGGGEKDKQSQPLNVQPATPPGLRR